MLQRFVLAGTLATLLSLTLAACGGGGGGSSSPPTPPPPTNQAPTASFTQSASSGAAPLLLTVNGSASSDSDGSISRYNWDFGESGATAIGANAQYSYTTAGNFTVRLTVTDNDGATATTTGSLQVTASAGTASLSGTITILSSSAIDADVNDRLTIAGDNNSFANAQPLPLPTTLGGFANLPNTGANTGNLFASGDPGDFYRLDFTGNEVILLTIAETTADLDMRLYDSNQNLVDASLGVDRTEVLNVTTAGSYFVEVFAVLGASNYILNIGQNLETSQFNRAPTRLSDPFVAGEIIQQAATIAGASVTRTRANISGNPTLVRLNSSQPLSNLAANSSSKAVNTNSPEPFAVQLPKGALANAELLLKHRTLNRVKELNADLNTPAAEVNLLRRAYATPNDAFYNRQWHYDNINLPTAWDTTTGSNNVIVAVIDTGVLTAHPDLSNQLVPGFDFISDAARANDGDGIDNNPNDPGDNSFGGSSSFHGTHVAGTVAAETDNSIGVAGVAWDARIMPMRALGVDGGTNFDVIQAMRFAAGFSNNSNTLPSQPADIINLSLGSEFSSQSEQDTINQIVNQGILVVASAGNDSSTLPSYPAAYDGVISVSASTISNTIAGYSNTGSTIDVAAPGGNTATDLNGDGIGDGVVSTIGDDGGGPVQFGYAALNGTSMAAPHVAGVAALMKAVHPALTPTEFNNALLAGDLTDDLGAPGRDDNYGFGLINAHKAVLTAQNLASGGSSNPGPILSASASSLSFGAFGTNLTWTLRNSGDGTLTVGTLTSSEPWATVTAQAVDANGLGDYQIAIDRAGLADGSYSAEIEAPSNSNSATVRIIMQVASANPVADSGLHYVIVVDQNGNSTVPADVVSVSNGSYSFTINDVPFGEYEVFGGSDSDDDNFLCDGGEACGAFRTLDSPDKVQVNGNLGGLDFVTNFRSSLGTLSTNSSGAESTNRGIKITKPAPTGVVVDKTAAGE